MKYNIGLLTVAAGTALTSAYGYSGAIPLSERRVVSSAATHQYPLILERRMLTNRKGKIKYTKGRQLPGSDPTRIGGTKRRADSPHEESDTRVKARLTGPGQIAVHRQKDERPDSELVNSGQAEKEKHDPLWSKAEVHAYGNPPHGANSQSPLLHPARVEGNGQSGKVVVEAPRGGYGQLKKEVDGQATIERVPGGQRREMEHRGAQPGEVTLSGTAARGGSAFLQVNNVRTSAGPPQLESSAGPSQLGSSHGPPRLE